MKTQENKDDKSLPVTPTLFLSIRQLIDESKKRVVVTVNVELTVLYWQIGNHINAALLQGERAEYGKRLIEQLSHNLTAAYGNGWSERQLRYCLRIAEVLPDIEILNTLCAKLSWSQLRLLIVIEDPVKRDFYIELCMLEQWSVRQLQDRTALSKKPEQLELLELDNSGINVAEYLTVLQPRKILQKKLHQSIDIARRRIIEKVKKDVYENP